VVTTPVIKDVRWRHFRSLANLPAAIRIAEIATLHSFRKPRRRSLEFEEGSITWRDEKLPNWVT
jgi:predicted ABC-type ATPase